ncbi:MAG TPA: response regulator [Flavitalea sp.]|nr:response regulator [Flavitalea sp.]
MKKKIVVVEDDESISDILKIMLERAGYDITNFYDGTKLMNGVIEKADLYLIDRQLSGVDGIELCKHLKSHTLTAEIPVIILSATPGLENMVKNAGAMAFIEKPFSKNHLLQTIEKALG